MSDEYHRVEQEVRPEDLIKMIFNAIDRGPRQPKKLISAKDKKKKQEQERQARANRDKLRRATRKAFGLCTRCGKEPPAEGKRMCEDCQEKGRNYLKGV